MQNDPGYVTTKRFPTEGLEFITATNSNNNNSNNNNNNNNYLPPHYNLNLNRIEDPYERIDVVKTPQFQAIPTTALYASIPNDHTERYTAKSSHHNIIPQKGTTNYSIEPGSPIYAQIDRAKKLSARQKSANAIKPITRESFRSENVPKARRKESRRSSASSINPDLVQALKREMMNGPRGGHRPDKSQHQGPLTSNPLMRAGRPLRLPPVCGRSPPCFCPQDQMLASKLRLRNVMITYVCRNPQY